MKEKLMAGYWRCRLAFAEKLNKFAKEERGDQTLVTVLVLIVIVIGLAAIFRKNLEGLMTAVFEKFSDIGIDI